MSNNPLSASSLASLFAQPTAAYRGKPFWSWNGRLQKEELLRQVHIFQKMGMGGFFMHSRTGLQTEYLGEEWFACINACADEAERLGLEAWLYDEDRWPSGSAGGLATQDPRFRSKVLRLQIVDGAALQWPAQEKFVAAFVADVDGLSFTTATPLAHAAAAPAGSRVLLFTTEMWGGHSFYNGFTYLDTLSRAATDHFLEITHERYAAQCGSRLGRSIRGIFTDEPHHGTVMCENAENRALADQRWTTPWTESLFADFTEAWGYDLRAHLPELFLQRDGRRVSRVKWHYMELLQRLFLRNWAEPMHAWCQSHQLALTGHVLHEDSLVAQAVPSGSVMRYYEHLDIPGVDVLALDNRNYWIVKQLASAARQLERPWMLSELYGCSGWQLDFAGHKRIGTWQALLGINVRCHHLSWVTMEGEAKRDYPASIAFQSAWWRQYAVVEDFFSRLHVMLQQGVPVCEVLVLNPIESTWAQIHPGWAQWLGALDPELEKLEAIYRNVFTWLLAAQIDFDYGDEELLARLGRVEAGILRVGAGRYRAVVVAGAVTMRRSTCRLLREFTDAGGAVIFAGEPPAHIDCEPADAVSAVQPSRCALSKGALIAAVSESCPPALRIGGAPEEIMSQVRRDGDRWIVALLNLSAEKSSGELQLHLAATGQVEEWQPENGERQRLAAQQANGTEWTTELPPLGVRLFLLAPESSAELEIHSPPTAAESRPLAGPFAYTLDEPNLCVLDFAEWQLGDGAWQPAAEILKVDEQVRTKLGLDARSGVMLQPWAAEKFAPAAPAEPTPLSLRFKFTVSQLPATGISLLVERPDSLHLAVNGASVTAPAETAWLIDPCFRLVPLPADTLRVGENEITLDLSFTAAFALEAIYLVGEFGVELNTYRPRLTSLPEKLHPRDIASQGLPFYSGKITYRLSLDPTLAGRGAQLALDRFGGALAQIRTECADSGPLLAWPPYTADISELIATGASEILCEIWLTRRNTFGPLHLLPLEQAFVGPMSFRSNGPDFTESYVLIENGLLTPPRLLLGPPM